MKLFVALNWQQARLAMRGAGIQPRPDWYVGTDSQDYPKRLSGLLIKSEDVVWVDGWMNGQYAMDVEKYLKMRISRAEAYDN